MIKLEWNRINGAKLVDKEVSAPVSIAFEMDEEKGHVFYLYAATVEDLEELGKAFSLYYSYAQYFLQMNNPEMLQHGLNDLDGKGYIIDANDAGIRLLPKRDGNADGVTALTKSDDAYGKKVSLFLTKVETDAQMNEILCGLGDAGGMAFMF